MDQYLRLLWLIPLGFFCRRLWDSMEPVAVSSWHRRCLSRRAPETITSISLASVFFNALSGTLAYAKSKRIDYKLDLFSRSLACREPSSERWRQLP